ncbi:hypothetical protein GTO27_03540 [Candidatus Bathyarchaeota archaeon]|nr:hypothetical protein [Candidatus Bathyarchaeota archaeon]
MKYFLPFSSPSKDRKEPFTKESERAAIFCLAELERAKGRGVLLKQSIETLAFITEVFYPFWLTSLGKVNFFFDGLSTTSQKFSYHRLPDIQGFLDNMKKTSKTRQAYTTFLSDNLNYFNIPSSQKTETISGLMTDHEILGDLKSYLTEAKPKKESPPNVVTISPTIDESSIISTMEELQDQKSKLTKDVDVLYSTMRVLEETTQSFLKLIRNEIRKTREEFKQQIEEQDSSISKLMDEIREEYGEQVTEYSRDAEDELVILQQEKIKLEKTENQLIREVEQSEAEIKTSAINKDRGSEQRWREKKDDLKSQLSEINAELKQVNKKIEDVKDEKNRKIFELKSERDAKIKEVRKDLMEVESSRDAKIQIYEDEMEKLEELTSNMISKMDKLAKNREKTLNEFNELGIRRFRDGPILIYIPFYLAAFQSSSGTRYATFAPSMVNTIGLSVKLKGALRKPKVKQLLQSRSQEMTSFLNKFPSLMNRTVVFNREMNEACSRANTLSKDSLGSIRIGLENLKEEGWLSEKEYESLIQELP